MSKTYFENGVVVTPEMLNSIYHTADGHKHDGLSEDGHCAQISRSEIADGAIDASKLDMEFQNYKAFQASELSQYFFIQEFPEVGPGPRTHLYIEIIGGEWHSLKRSKFEYIVGIGNSLEVQRQVFGTEFENPKVTIKIFDRKVYLYLSSYTSVQVRASYYNSIFVKNEVDFIRVNAPIGELKYDGVTASHQNYEDIKVRGSSGSSVLTADGLNVNKAFSASTLKSHELKVAVQGSSSVLDFNSINIGSGGKIAYETFEIEAPIVPPTTLPMSLKSKFSGSSATPISYQVMMLRDESDSGYENDYWEMETSVSIKFKQSTSDDRWYLKFGFDISKTSKLKIITWMLLT